MLDLIFILPALAGLLCLGLAALTLTRSPRSPVNLGFAAGLVCLMVIEAGAALILVPESPLIGPRAASLGVVLFVTGQAALPPAWGVFAAVFSRPGRADTLRRWSPLVIASVIASAAFIVFNRSLVEVPYDFYGGGWADAGDEPYRLYRITAYGHAMYVYMVVGLAFNLLQLENTLRASSGTTRWQIKYIVFGVGAVLAYFIYLSSQVLLFDTMDVSDVAVVSAVIAISVLVLGVFIVRHRLLEVDIFISRYVVYNSVTILIIGLYLLAAGLVAELLTYFGGPFNRFLATVFVFTTLLVLVVFLFTSTIRRKFKLYINRHFYRHKYEFRDRWMETTERVSSKRTVPEIKSMLVEMISENMGSKSVHIWLHAPGSGEFVCSDYEVPADYRRLGTGHPIVAEVTEMLSPFHFPSNDRSAHADGKETEGNGAGETAGSTELAAATGAEVCAPLVAGHEVVGFMLIGADLSGQPYVEDDFEYLSAVTTQAAVQIRNIELTRELMTVNELDLFNKMSYFIMHDLKNLTNSLSLVSQNARENMDNPEFQADAISTIDATVTRMRRLIERLSTIPTGIEVKRSRTDIAVIVNNTLKKAPINPKKKIDIGNRVSRSIPLYVDPEAIEMVVFNIVSNAVEAIKETGSIVITAAATDSEATLSITDDGPGMTEEFIHNDLFKPFKSTKKKGFGIGLYQSKAVVEAHGGSIDVTSAQGSGTTFTIRLPRGT